MIKLNAIYFILISAALFSGIIANVEASDETSDERVGTYMIFCSNNANTLDDCKEKYDYSWGDKFTVLVFAPTWNTDKNKLDRIGNTVDHPISVHTNTGNVDGPCEFVETDFNTGLFKGRIKLSGFRHDANGDGSPDLFGGNACNQKSPLQEAVKVASDRTGNVTVVWQITDDTIISKSAKYSWRIGTIEFDKKVYESKDKIKVSLRDADLQVFPFSGDTKLWIRSDTDSAGIILTVEHEFGDLFPGEFDLTESKTSSGNRLRISPGDNIYVQYVDKTLPPPYSVSDELEIESTAMITGDSSSANEITIANLTITNGIGKVLDNINSGQKVLVTPTLENTKQNYQPFTCIVQVKDSTGRVVDLTWASGQLGANQVMNHPHQWTPENSGIYTIEVYLWESIGNPLSLSSVRTMKQAVS